MKRLASLQRPDAGESKDGRPTDMSAEAVLRREIAELAEWLAAQGLDPRDDAAHEDEGSRDRLYWCYGYFMGLKQALAMLTSRGETVH